MGAWYARYSWIQGFLVYEISNETSTERKERSNMFYSWVIFTIMNIQFSPFASGAVVACFR